jgi:hypothetical protein
MQNYSKVYGYEELSRDNATGAIINTDKTLFDNTKQAKSASGIIKRLQSDVETLKNELSEIKNLLIVIAGK